LLPPLPVDGIDPAGTMVSALLADRATDFEGATLGMAVAGLTGAGIWQFSADSGATWNAIGNVSPSNVLLLSSDSLVRFVPMAGWEGTATLDFYAWDRTAGRARDRAAPTALAASLSSALETAFVSVGNSAPVIV
jgi:hypothetical protein